MTDRRPVPDDSKPGTRWQDEPLAWLVFGLPAAVVVACMVTLVIAIRSSDTLVVDDYYKVGLEINRVLAREEQAAALGLDMNATLAPDGRFDVLLHAPHAFRYPATLDIRFMHATRGSDRVIAARHAGAGHYRGRVAPFIAGSWYVDLATPKWRIVRRVVR